MVTKGQRRFGRRQTRAKTMATNTTQTDLETVTDESDDEIECACDLDHDLGCYEHYEVDDDV